MNNNKIVSTKRFSAVFLAIVLVTGTIALSFPSFIIKGVNAQSQPYYYDGGMDNRYNSYQPQEYQSYKPDYKPTYPSYDGKDNRDKSNKDSSSDIINKIKCTTNNIVVNGNNTGDVNIGNNGQVPTAEEGYSGASSSSGYGEGYEGYSKQDKGFDCTIKNNNVINNIVAGAGGNVTDGNTTDPCIECILENLTPEQEIAVAGDLAVNFTSIGGTIQGLCEYLADETINPVTKYDTLTQILLRAEVPRDTIDDILDCLRALGFDIFDPPGLSSSPTPTRLGLSNLPTIAQGTEEDLSALEKIEKLKQQWLDLLLL